MEKIMNEELMQLADLMIEKLEDRKRFVGEAQILGVDARIKMLKVLKSGKGATLKIDKNIAAPIK